ncbi:MAG TPA: 50S ribosomal protein L32 [Dehalococcoidia bacterium]|nr:50S ribosomal protein L32 [Dehalococcoidia bacterium]
MPPLPKRKYPKSRQGKRRSHHRATTSTLVDCPQCNSPRLPHHACPICGNYRGRQAVEIETPELREESPPAQS